MGGQKALICTKFMVACEASGEREHGHDSKQEHQVEGPIMQKRSGQERLGGATRGARGQESHEGEMIMLGERAEPGGRSTPGRLAQTGRPGL
jgi:hypothetical protein